MIDKNLICYLLRKNYPEILGIRKRLQRIKVDRLTRTIMPKEDIEKCEKYPEKTRDIILPYLNRWKKNLSPVMDEMKDILDNSSKYRNIDKEQIRIDMLFCRLAYGFIPSEYVSFEFENKTLTERKEYVSDIDTNIFGYSVNNIKKLQSILDKADCYEQFAGYFHRDALIISQKQDYEKFHKFVCKHPEYVEKLVFSSMGKGVRLVDIRKVGMTEKQYFYELISQGKHLLEERVYQNSEMAKFNESSVNTIRCITFCTYDGIKVPYCFMRTGKDGAFVDNGGSGGLVIGVNTVTGIVDTDGFDEYNNRYLKHPNTGVRFKGSQIPAWNELIDLCKEAAKEVEGMGYLSWDLAYTDNGWVVIEVNEVGQFIGPQMTMKRGIKKELCSYMTRMKEYI